LSYKLRNIIVLISLVVLLGGVSGYFTLYHYPKKIKIVQKKIDGIKKQISNLAGVEEEYKNIEKIIKEKEQRLANLDRKIVPAVTPANSYQYLNTILNYSGVLDFDMLYQGVKSAGRYSYNVYNIKGEGPYYKIYKFITFLEKGPQVYKINKLTMRMVEDKDKETSAYRIIITFEMEIWALFADVQNLPPIKRTLGNVYVKRASNPFYPYIYRNIPANVDERLEVERAELKAILPDKIMVADAEGKIHELQEGDKVYLGYLKRIDHENNKAYFVLNKGGIVETFELHIRFGEETTGK